MAPRSNTGVEVVCNKCAKEVKLFVTCAKCFKTYHPSCVLKIFGLYVGGCGEIICCDNITSKRTKDCLCKEKDKEIHKLKGRITELNEFCFEESISKQQISIQSGNCSLGDEMAIIPEASLDGNVEDVTVKYLSMIIEEKTKLIEEMQDKIKVMKKYTSLLEKIEEEREAPSIDSISSECYRKLDQQTKTDHPVIAEKSAIPTSINNKFETIKKKTAEKTADREEIDTNIEGIERRKWKSDNSDKTKSKDSKTGNKNFAVRRRETGVTGTGDNLAPFSGAPKLAWIYVGRVSRNVEKDQIESHLKNHFPNENFIIEKLPSRDDSRSSSFRVGANMALVENLYSPENWPIGVVVRRFRFFLGGRKSGKQEHQRDTTKI